MGVAQGKKVAMRCCGIGGRGEADLRPDQPIEEAVLERSLDDEKTEIVVTSRDRQKDTPDAPPRLISPFRVSTYALSPRPQLPENVCLRVCLAASETRRPGRISPTGLSRNGIRLI